MLNESRQPRTLIIPAYRGRGAIGLAAVLGALSGLLSAWFLTTLVLLPTPPRVGIESGLSRLAMILISDLVVLFLLLFAFPVLFSLVSQRRWRVSLLSGIFLAAVSVRWFGPILSWRTALDCVAAGIVGALLALPARWIVRRRIVIQEQTGDLCWRCSRELGGAAACGVCGTPSDPRRFRIQWLHSGFKWGRRLGWPGVLVLLPFAFLWTTTGWEHYQQHRHDAERLQALGKLGPGWYVPPGSAPANWGTPASAAAIPLDPSASLELFVCEVPDGDGSMQVEVWKVLRYRFGSFHLYRGNPRIFCDLDPAQANHIVEHGLPQPLIDALLEAAANSDWSGMRGTRPDVRVDARPHVRWH